MKEQKNVLFTVDKAARKSDTTRHWLTVSLNYWPHSLWPHINRVRRSPQLPGRVTPILYDQQCRFLHVSFESTTEKTTPTAWRHLSMFSIISSFITLTGSTNYLRSAERNGFVFFDVLKKGKMVQIIYSSERHPHDHDTKVWRIWCQITHLCWRVATLVCFFLYKYCHFIFTLYPLSLTIFSLSSISPWTSRPERRHLWQQRLLLAL